MSITSPKPPGRENTTKCATSPLVLSRSSQKHKLPTGEIIHAANLAGEEVWEELLDDDEYFIDLTIDTVHDYLDDLAAETAASIFREIILGELIPQLIEPSIREEMIHALVIDEVCFEITDALVETLFDVGHFSLPEHDHEIHGSDMHHYISHIRKASEMHVKRKLALHTHRIKQVTAVKKAVKENRHSVAAEVSPWLTKKTGGMTKEQEKQERFKEQVTNHSTYLRRKKGSSEEAQPETLGTVKQNSERAVI